MNKLSFKFPLRINLFDEGILVFLVSIFQSLRAKTEQTLTRQTGEEADSRIAAKQLLSFTLSDPVLARKMLGFCFLLQIN